MKKIYVDNNTNYDEIIKEHFWDSLEDKEPITLVNKEYENISSFHNMYSIYNDINVSFVHINERLKMIEMYKKITNIDIIKIIKISNYEYKLKTPNNIIVSKDNIEYIINDFENLIINNNLNDIFTYEQNICFLNLMVEKASNRNKKIIDYYNSYDKDEFIDSFYSMYSASLKNVVYVNDKHYYGYISNYFYQTFTHKMLDISLLINDLYNYNYKIESLKLYAKYKKAFKHLDFFMNLVMDKVSNFWVSRI